MVLASNVILRGLRRTITTLSAYDIRPGIVVFYDGRYVEIIKASPSTNKKLPSTYKVELLDLFANQVSKQYFKYSQIERLDVVETSKVQVEFQYADEAKGLLIFSDDLYNQHEVPAYLYRGNISVAQPGARFSLMMDGCRYIRIL